MAIDYGTFKGEMAVEDLAVQIDWFCGCGNPESAAKALLEFLEFFPLYNSQQEFQDWMPTNWGQRYLFLYLIDHQTEWLEHGGGIGGSWLTERGNKVRDALRVEKERDDFESLFPDYGRCIHGNSTDDTQHNCSTAPEPSKKSAATPDKSGGSE